MPFKPNYEQQRGDRNRAKEQKKKEKLLSRDEEAARRRASIGQDKAEAENAPAQQSPPSVEGGDVGQK